MDLVLGRIVKSHGVRGEVVVDVRTDDPAARFARDTTVRGLLPKGAGEQQFTITSVRWHAERLLMSIGGITSRDAADALRGVLFVIDSSLVDSGDDPDEFYDHEIIGATVVTVGGDSVGTLRDVLHLPGGDTLVVADADGREILVPFVTEMVPTVSPERIEIDPPDGLLDPQ